MLIITRSSSHQAVRSLGIAKARPREKIHSIADSYAPEIASAIKAAVDKIKDETVLVEIQRALESGDLTKIEGLIPWDRITDQQLRPQLSILLRRTLEEAGTAGQKTLPVEITGGFEVNTRSVEWARNESSKLIRDMTDEHRGAIRVALTESIERGIHPYSTARIIRDHVGLTDAYARAVMHYMNQLIEDGMSLGKAQDKAQKYAERLVRYRSKMIARTESLRAAHMGQQEAWRQGVESGQLDIRRIERSWVVTPDSRLCEICAPMQGQVVSLETEFVGYRKNAQGAVVERLSSLVPPLHPACRCTMVLRIKK